MSAPAQQSASVAARLNSFPAALDEFVETDPPFSEFFAFCAQQLQQRLDCPAAAVWMTDESRRTHGLLWEAGLSGSGLLSDPSAGRLNQTLLKQTAAEQSPQTADFRIRSPLEADAVLLLPIVRQDRAVAVIELFGSQSELKLADATDRSLLETIGEIGSRYVERLEQAVAAADPRRRHEAFTALSQRLHDSLDSHQVAAVAVNELQSLLTVDRVTLLTGRPGRERIVAASGQRKVNRRSQQARGIEQIVQSLGRRDEPFVFDGRSSDLPAEQAETVAQYVAQSQARMLWIQPLTPPVPADVESAQPARCGVLVCEQFSESRPRPALGEHIDQAARQTSLALRNAQRHERVLIPGVQSIATGLHALRGRQGAIVLATIVALCAALVAAACIPMTHGIEADGTLVPITQRRVFAPSAGEIVSVHVRNGETVAAGDRLLQLANPDLEAELLTARGRSNELRQALVSLNSQLAGASGGATASAPREQALIIQAELQRSQIELRAVEQQISRLKRQIEQLTVRAPINGTIVSADPQQRLTGRPVQRGDLLLEVMDQTGEWHLDVEIPEQNSGHVLSAWTAAGELPVRFRMAANPTVTCDGRLHAVDDRATPSIATGSTVRARVAVDETALPLKRIGADVQARIECGERSTLYVAFGQLYEFLQRRFWL